MMRVNPWRAQPDAVLRQKDWKKMYTEALRDVRDEVAVCGDLVDAVVQMVRTIREDLMKGRRGC